MAKIYKDGTNQYLLFRATSAVDYTAFTGTVDGEALPGATVVISEYKKDDETIETPTVTWNATIGKWKAVIPAANITQYGVGELNVSGTGMIPVSIEFETVSKMAYKKIVPAGSYALDASEKTITLSGGYTGVTVEQILSIRNLSKNMLIYDSNIPNHAEITLESSVINYNYDGTMEDTDKIQIVVITE